MSHSSEAIGASTRSLHADDALNLVTDVAPPMHLSTTFRYSNDPTQLVPAADATPVCILTRSSMPHSLTYVSIVVRL
jgi:cystathionine beta-lyase